MFLSNALRCTALALVCVCFSVDAAENSNAYVTQDLQIHVRTGPTEQYRIAYFLVAGTPLELVGEPTENGFQQIRDPRGREGWIETRWLMPEAGAKEQLAGLQQQNKNLNEKYQQDIATLEGRLSSAQTQIKESLTFRQQISELQTTNTTLTLENQRYRDRFQQEIFFAGAVVVIVGMLIGFLLGRMFRNKRSGWS